MDLGGAEMDEHAALVIGALTSFGVGSDLSRLARRLTLIAACVLAAMLLPACGSNSSTGATQPSATTAATGDNGNTGNGGNQGGQPGQNYTPTPARKSFFDQLSATGEAKEVTVSGVPKGATCSATAQVAGGGAKVPSNQPGLKAQTAADADSSLSFQLDLPEQTLKSPVTVLWSVTCQLSGQSRTLNAQFKWDGS